MASTVAGAVVVLDGVLDGMLDGVVDGLLEGVVDGVLGEDAVDVGEPVVPSVDGEVGDGRALGPVLVVVAALSVVSPPPPPLVLVVVLVVVGVGVPVSPSAWAGGAATSAAASANPTATVRIPTVVLPCWTVIPFPVSRPPSGGVATPHGATLILAGARASRSAIEPPT